MVLCEWVEGWFWVLVKGSEVLLLLEDFWWIVEVEV